MKQWLSLLTFSPGLLGYGGITYGTVTLLHIILRLCLCIHPMPVVGQEAEEAYYLTNDTSIEYIGRWPSTFEVPNDPLQFTWYATAYEGNKAQYTFHGIQVVVTGKQASPSFNIKTATTYKFDDQTIVYFAASGDYEGVLFTSPTISPGTHTLTMTNINSSRFGPYGFEVTPNPPGFNESAPSSSLTPTQAKPSGSAPRPPATTETQHNNQPQQKAITPGAIVGIILGGLFAVATAGWISRAMRKRRSNTYPLPTDTPYPVQDIITPWRLSRFRGSRYYEVPRNEAHINLNILNPSSLPAQATSSPRTPFQSRHGSAGFEDHGGTSQLRLSTVYPQALHTYFGYTRMTSSFSVSSISDEVPPPYTIYK